MIHLALSIAAFLFLAYVAFVVLCGLGLLIEYLADLVKE